MKKSLLLLFLLFIKANLLFAQEDIVNNSTINGTGTINGTVTNNAIIGPGDNGIGKINITGDLKGNSSSVYNIQLSSNTDYDNIEIGGNMVLGGTINVTLINGFIISSPFTYSFTLFKYKSKSGSFPWANINLPTIPGTYAWSVYDNDTEFIITAKSNALCSAIYSPLEINLNQAGTNGDTFYSEGFDSEYPSANVPWILIDQNNFVTALPNNTNQSRAGYIYVSDCNGNVGFGTYVTQQGVQITSSPNTWAPPYNSSGVNQTVTITSNVAWVAESDNSWLSLSNYSGSGNGSIILSAAPNTITSARTATVTITVGGVPNGTITITQAASPPTLSIDPPTWAASGTGGASLVNITSNSPWTVSSNQTWLTSNIASGSNNGVLTLTAASNYLITTRTAIVTISVAGIPVQTVTVTQAGGPPTLSLSYYNYNMTSGNSATTVLVNSNSPWTLTTSGSVSASPSSFTGSKYVSWSIGNNYSTTPRTATITVTVAGLPPQTLTINQAGAIPTLSVSPTTWSPTSAGGTQSILVASTMPWTVTSDQVWLTLSASSGLGNDNTTLAAASNGTISSRTATVTYTVSGLPVQTVTVNQAAGAATLSITPTTWSPTASSSTQAVTVTSNSPWTVSSNQAWLTLSAGSGTGNGSTTLTAAVNSAITTRSATVTYTVTGLPVQTVTITQAAAAATLSISPTTWSPTNAGGNQAITITSNSPWTVSSNQAWVTLSAASGTGNGTNTLTAAANGTISARSATVTYTVSGLPVQTVTVNQAAGAATLTVSPTTWAPVVAGGTQAVTVTSNAPWTVTSNQSWVTLSAASGTGNGTSTLTAALNNTSAARTATVTYTVTGIPVKTVTVSQAAPTLTISPTTWSPPASSSTQTITVTSNAPWTVTSNQAWVTLSSSTGSGNGTNILTAAVNGTSGSRTATVTYTVAGIAVKTVAITQAAPSLTISPSSWNANVAGGTQAITVTSNSGWTVSSNQPWVTLSAATGIGNGTITLTATANGTITARNATVTFTTAGVTARTVTVSQVAGAPTLSATPTTWNPTSAANSTSITVTSNSAWTLTSNKTWLTTNIASSTGNNPFTINVTGNTGAARSGTITVRVNTSLAVVVTVSQNATGMRLSAESAEEVEGNYSIVYPNPAEEFVNVRIPDIVNLKNQISLKSSNGKEIFKIRKDEFNSEGIVKINISKIPAGMYFIEYQYIDNRRKMIKLVKK